MSAKINLANRNSGIIFRTFTNFDQEIFKFIQDFSTSAFGIRHGYLGTNL